MHKFIMKCSLFFLIILILFFSIGLFKSTHSSLKDYMAAIIDKHRQIKIIKSSKIILGGGSNLAFGVDSKELERSFGMPVINMGLNAGLGLTFILNELKYSIKENDIVFLSIEYFLAKEGSNRLKLYTSNFFPPAHNFYSTNYLLELNTYLETNRDIYKNIFSKSTNDQVYSRMSFNQNGDFVGHLDQPNLKKIQPGSTLIYKYWEGIDEINKFYEYAKSKKVSVFFLFPNFPTSEYNKNKKAIELLESDMKKNLKVEILNSPADFVFPDTCFFDTVYHLNKLGRKKRTDKMIELIERNLNVHIAFTKSRAGKIALRL